MRPPPLFIVTKLLPIIKQEQLVDYFSCVKNLLVGKNGFYWTFTDNVKTAFREGRDLLKAGEIGSDSLARKILAFQNKAKPTTFLIKRAPKTNFELRFEGTKWIVSVLLSNIPQVQCALMESHPNAYSLDLFQTRINATAADHIQSFNCSTAQYEDWGNYFGFFADYATQHSKLFRESLLRYGGAKQQQMVCAAIASVEEALRYAQTGRNSFLSYPTANRERKALYRNCTAILRDKLGGKKYSSVMFDLGMAMQD